MVYKFLCVLPRALKTSKLKNFRARFACPFIFNSNFFCVWGGLTALSSLFRALKRPYESSQQSPLKKTQNWLSYSDWYAMQWPQMKTAMAIMIEYNVKNRQKKGRVFQVDTEVSVRRSRFSSHLIQREDVFLENIQIHNRIHGAFN